MILEQRLVVCRTLREEALRTGRGRYMVHPSAAWNGPLAGREAAARKLEPVD
jgi:hypothetical protein